MEIGDQAVDRLEAVARRDEDRRVVFERMDAAGLVGGAFEQAQAGRADGDQAATGGADLVEPLGRVGVDAAPFGVHLVVARVVGLDRKKGSGADVEGQRFALHAS